MTTQRILQQIGWLSIVASIAGAYIAVLTCMAPRMTDGAVFREGHGGFSSFIYPLQGAMDTGMFRGHLRMRIAANPPEYLRVRPDDCLEQISLNGTELLDEKFCEFSKGSAAVHGKIIDVRTSIRPGVNDVEFTFVNTGGDGGIIVTIPWWDPSLLLVHVLFALAFLLTYLLWKRIERISLLHPGEGWIIFLGCALRLWYMLETDITARQHDATGHLEYVQHLLSHWSLPSPQDGWEFFQPPLYYVLSALGVFPLKMLGADLPTLTIALQVQAFLVSCAVLILTVWIGRMLFSAPHDRPNRLLFLAMITAWPAIVYLSARPTNDILLFFFGVLFIGMLIRWWETRSDLLWVMLHCVIGCALITKSNAIPWLIVPTMCLLLQRRPWRELLRHLGMAAVFVAATAGWYYLRRFGLEGESHIVGNLAGNNEGLKIETSSFWNYVVFRPWHVLQYPFNNSWVDTYGRRFFWEHLLKSGITGEWNFGMEVSVYARPIIALFIVSIFGAIYGMSKMTRSMFVRALPCALLFLSSIAASMALVVTTRIGGFQDFRYVPFLALLVAAFLVKGVALLPTNASRVFFALLSLYVALCGLLIVTLLTAV